MKLKVSQRISIFTIEIVKVGTCPVLLVSRSFVLGGWVNCYVLMHARLGYHLLCTPKGSGCLLLISLYTVGLNLIFNSFCPT